jgi:hypothetical protein
MGYKAIPCLKADQTKAQLGPALVLPYLEIMSRIGVTTDFWTWGLRSLQAIGQKSPPFFETWALRAGSSECCDLLHQSKNQAGKSQMRILAGRALNLLSPNLSRDSLSPQSANHCALVPFVSSHPDQLLGLVLSLEFKNYRQIVL